MPSHQMKSALPIIMGMWPLLVLHVRGQECTIWQFKQLLLVHGVPAPTHSQGADALLEATISEASQELKTQIIQEQQTPNAHLRKYVPP